MHVSVLGEDTYTGRVTSGYAMCDTEERRQGRLQIHPKSRLQSKLKFESLEFYLKM